MHAIRILQQILQKSCPNQHLSRQKILLRCVESTFNNGKLAAASLGRHMRGHAQVRYKIKSADRLLGNSLLYQEKTQLYKALAATLTQGKSVLEIIVDWSVCIKKEFHILRASLICHGRSMTLYEEIHPQSKQGNPTIHQHFLVKLKEFLPKNAKVIIITDAGFKTDWFELVQAQGWNFLGRLRANIQYSYDKATWQECTSLYSQANSKVQYLGAVYIAKTKAFHCYMTTYKENLKLQNKAKKKSTKVEKYRKSHLDAWVLVSSLLSTPQQAAYYVKTYSKRMKIEHEFRTLKNEQWGLGLSYSRSYHIERLEILLLIALLGIFCLYLIGLAAEQLKLHYRYQANSIKHRRVLSLIFLGLQLLHHPPPEVFYLKIFTYVLNNLLVAL